MFTQVRDWFNRTFSDPQVVILAILLIAGAFAVIFFGQMLMPALAALVIAYLLEGPVQRLQRVGLPRMISVSIVFSAFLAFLVFLLFALVPVLIRQLAGAVAAVPAQISRAQLWLAGLPERYPQLVHREAEAVPDDVPLALISEEQLSVMLNRLGEQVASYGERVVELSVTGASGLVTLLIFLVLIPVLVFFFLKDKQQIMHWFAGYLPRNRGLAATVWEEVDKQMSNYVRGKVLEILIVWVVTYAVFLLLGLNFAMLLSLLVGLSVIIPFIGAAVVTIPVALVALIQFGPSAMFVWTLVAYLIIQILDGNVLVPVLFSEAVSLHPVAIIVAILLFGGLWGFWGIFFAIPLATLVNAVLRAWPRAKQDEVGEAA